MAIFKILVGIFYGLVLSDDAKKSGFVLVNILPDYLPMMLCLAKTR